MSKPNFPSSPKPTIMFGTPLVVLNLTHWLASKNRPPIDHGALAAVALEGFREANVDTLVDEVHGSLTPNNAFFEYQMAHANEATADELRAALTGWPRLAASSAWQGLVAALRAVLAESRVLSDLLGNDPSCKNGAARATRAAGTVQLSANVGLADTTRSAAVALEPADGSCNAPGEGDGFLGSYGWLSVHGVESEHQAHAHLDARLSAVYYIEVPTSGQTITFYDPRGLSPHLNLRFGRGITAPPFDEHYVHHPQAGQLLIFPSWLVHSVDIVSPEEKRLRRAGPMRLSASFNLGEGWERTAPRLFEAGAS